VTLNEELFINAGEVLALMEKDRKKYQPIIDRIVGQIWDSVVDFEVYPLYIDL